MKLSEHIKSKFKDFGLTEEEVKIPGIEKVDHEKDTLSRLDRSAKFDEIDTVAFGLETDDNKIVKVYVKAEQSEDFEKALSTKLGEIDDIEQVLNELSKDFEIVDVDWPDEEDNQEEDPDEVGDGSEIMDKKVYKKDENEESVEESIGDKAAISILESTTSIESRFSTSAQLMVYHAIIDLGIPEIALARSPYRAAIIKGIRERASEIQSNAAMKTALKAFIKRVVNFDQIAKDNEDGQSKEPVKKEEVKQDMKIAINEEKIEWDFSQNKDAFVIKSPALSFALDPEETEKMVKGVTNRDAVVVKDMGKGKKVVFSPRGSNVLVKLVGSSEGYMMSSKDIDELLNAISPEKEPVEESLKFAKKGVGNGPNSSPEHLSITAVPGSENYSVNHWDGKKHVTLEKNIKGWDKAVEAIKKFHAKTGIPLDYDLKGLKESVFKINFSKPLVDNFDAWNGKKIKVGRNVIKGYPVDIDDSDGTFLEMTAVDADAAKGLMKIMREAGFIVKIARGKELSVDMPAKPGDRV
jgi:hypothetical protein